MEPLSGSYDLGFQDPPVDQHSPISPHEYNSKEIMLRLYKTLVRPHLEYCQQCWAPHLRHDVLSLERVQRKFRKMIKGMKGLKYEEHLAALTLCSLELRQMRRHLNETYRMLKGLDKVDVEEVFPVVGHSHKVKGPPFQTEWELWSLSSLAPCQSMFRQPPPTSPKQTHRGAKENHTRPCGRRGRRHRQKRLADFRHGDGAEEEGLVMGRFPSAYRSSNLILTPAVIGCSACRSSGNSEGD
ncbi:uncharacterized protein LOC132385945 [Hypanus sabinus]|uniref:uncharacterized protein LOC132385945 n=1 Tax=Hypanus sabinus TaxID=79690 RepID=UPI0028C4039B|nr:uncharacterized protein LOC132385945 [Hypanus sabinus]